MLKSLAVLSTFFYLASGGKLTEIAEVKILRQDRSIFGNYHIEVKAFNEVHQLQLKRPAQSVFSPNFKLTIVDTDENGNHAFLDKTPTKDEMMRAERNLYVDPESLAAVRFHENDANNNLRISGVLNGIVINHENGQHIATRMSAAEMGNSDYVDLHRNTSLPPKGEPQQLKPTVDGDVIDLHRNVYEVPVAAGATPISTRAITSAQPELLIVFDYNNYQTFKGNNTAMTNYLSLFMHSVNNRYANLADPRVSFVVTGLTAISSESGQPFMTSSKIAGGDAYDINIMLDKFSEWAFSQSASLVKHDLASLFTGVHVQSKNSAGAYEDGVAGLAFLRAACWINTGSKKDLGTAVSVDSKGIFEGVMVAAHELAHNLGSPHDGQADSSNAAYGTQDCPWSGGYIMSYEGDGTKTKFYFSSCSATQMKNFLETPAASCTKTSQSTAPWAGNKLNPGDFFSMTTQCQISLNNSQAYVDSTRDPSSLCKNLACKYPDATDVRVTWTTQFNRMAADYSACGITEIGSCIDGECVIQPNMTTQCRTALNDPKATHDTSKTASTLCQTLSCRLADGTIKSLSKPAIDHSPCGFKGRCIDNKCDQPPIVVPASMSAQCQKATGKPKAYVDPTKTPDQLCTNLVCRYPADDNSGAIYIATLNRRPDDYSSCDTNKNCDNGKCVVLGG